jgi:16S rRNA (cytosine1402-N4)-methyltransferase
VASRFAHRPVLLEESLSLLELRPDALVVDGTVGGGGHAAAILERTAPDGRLIALDMDESALEAAGRHLQPFGDRVRLVHASFRRLSQILADLGVARVDGVLLDLGVSSPQLDEPARGFRFSGEAAERTPLDMRMDATSRTTAADLLAAASVDDLAHIFRVYGDLPGARRLARAIVAARSRAPLRTARDLLDVIASVRVGGGRRHHPATRVFQALRILGAGGRVVVLAYHSAEDRIVKNRFRDAARSCTCPPEIPVCVCGGVVRLRVVTRRPVRPTSAEVRANPRARSARLRAAERVAEAA